MRSRALVVALVTLVGALTAGGGQVLAATHAANSVAPPPATRPLHHLTRAAILAAPHHYVRSGSGGGIAAAPVRTALVASPQAHARGSAPSHPIAPVAHSNAALVAAAPSLLQGFQGTAQTTAIGDHGTDQRVAPPDPNIAVGPNDVVEATNSALYFFHRDGTPNGSVDINSLVQSPAGWGVTDPRVVYDPGSGRFFFSVLNFSATSCAMNEIILLVSGASGPTGTWSGAILSNLAANGPAGGAPAADQPGLGLSAGVLAVAWNYFDCASGQFYGSQLDIVQKSDLIAHVLGQNTAVAYTGGPASALPVFSLGPVGTQYVIFNNSDPVQSGTTPSIGVFPITGQPEQRNVSLQPEKDEPITATSVNSTTLALSSAAQSGTSTLLQTDDDRFLSAVWNFGTIWTSGGTNCTPSGDTVARACLNIVSVAANGTGSVTGDSQLPFDGVNGSYLYYPAIAVDTTGNAYIVYDQSSSTTFESIMVAAVQSGTLTNATTLHTSSTSFDYGGCDPTLGCRWGDYSGAVQDPNHPTDVWVVSEDTDGNNTANCNSNAHFCWNTYIGRYTFAPPSIASVTPAAGPVGGGQTVTVSGADFLPGTTATLGGTTVTVNNLTPESFQFVTPAHAAGLVYAQATDTLGSTPVPSTNAAYIYVGLGSYVPLTPFRIYDTRHASCVNAGCGSADAPLLAGQTRTITIAGTGFTGAGMVPTTAGAVVLNVTAVSGTSFSFLTGFPNGTAVPTASNLNFVAGQNIANLATLTLGQSSTADANREVNVFNSLGAVNLVVDLEGYFAAPSGNTGEFHPIAPLRICDTRFGQPSNVCNQGHASDNVLNANTWMKVNVTQATGGVPNDGTAEAVALNLTGVSGTAPTFLSVVPTSSAGSCPSSAATVSNLNLTLKTNQANRVIVPLGPDSSGAPTTDVCVYNSAGAINFILDLNGWFGSGAAAAGDQFQPISPVRVCDTRGGTGTECSGHTLTPNGSYTVPVAGVGGIPSSGPTPLAVVMNFTAVSGSQQTFFDVWPADQSRPNASDLNANSGQNIANLGVVALARTTNAGAVTIFNSQGNIDAIFDVNGWFQ